MNHVPSGSAQGAGAFVAAPSGGFRGILRDDVAVFRGIRYAAPPVGDLRFAPPVAAAVAETPVDATVSGPISIQDIDPDLIEDTGLKDRLGISEEDVAELRDSIARHGQQVPILLRPHPTLSGRYQVVYGRRRLAAIRGLGTPVKALIRTLSDEEAVLAQGQENNLRKDPSFIEKALFADKAFFVTGKDKASIAPFLLKKDAEAFAGKSGGKVVGFDDALKMVAAGG